MNRQFTRRRRGKGTQVTKRPAHTQGTKYGLQRVGLLGLLIMSGVEEGTLVSKQNLLKNIYDRRYKLQSNVHPFIYECLRKVEQLQPTNNHLQAQFISNQYAILLTSSNLFYHVQRTTWITTQFLSQKSIRFIFHKEVSRQTRVVQNFALKQLPSKIVDFQIFRGSLPIAILNFGIRITAITVSSIREEQKQIFQYELSSRAEKYLIQKDSLFVLLKNGNIVFGKIGDELDLLDAGKTKFQELKLCGSDVMVVTRNFIIKIITPSGNAKKIIRAGVEISNVIPIYISTNLYVLIAEQEGKTCLLNCYKSGKNNYLQPCPDGLDKIQQTLYIGKWILLRTQSNKIYAFALVKDQPVRIFQLYNGISPGMLKILHRKLIQT